MSAQIVLAQESMIKENQNLLNEKVILEEVIEELSAEISMYSSEESQTDSTPFITANGDYVYRGGIACPSKYKFGTRIKIDNEIFKCNDRMNKRYREKNNFDIWSESKEEALKFGRQTKIIQILK